MIALILDKLVSNCNATDGMERWLKTWDFWAVIVFKCSFFKVQLFSIDISFMQHTRVDLYTLWSCVIKILFYAYSIFSLHILRYIRPIAQCAVPRASCGVKLTSNCLHHKMIFWSHWLVSATPNKRSFCSSKSHKDDSLINSNSDIKRTKRCPSHFISEEQFVVEHARETDNSRSGYL